MASEIFAINGPGNIFIDTKPLRDLEWIFF